MGYDSNECLYDYCMYSINRPAKARDVCLCCIGKMYIHGPTTRVVCALYRSLEPKLQYVPLPSPCFMCSVRTFTVEVSLCKSHKNEYKDTGDGDADNSNDNSNDSTDTDTDDSDDSDC
jgi:hypothetical protein